MLTDGVLLIYLLVLAGLGSVVARRGLSIGGACGYAMGLPLSLSVFLFLGLTLLNVGGVPLWVNLVAPVIIMGLLAWRCWSRPLPQSDPTPFPRWQLGVLALVLFLSVFYLHSHQLMSTEDDFWIHFPEANHFLAENAKPKNPYFPEFALQGHYGRDLMLASFSLLIGRDVQRTQWIMELLLLVNSFFLWTLALRRMSGSPLGATLATTTVFMGVNVGSRIGLMTTYDNNNALVYLLLIAVLLVYWEFFQQRDKRLTAAAAFLTAVHASAYETNCVVAVGAFLVTTCILAWWESDSRQFLLKNVLAVLLIGGCLTLFQGGILSSVAQRALKGFEGDVDTLAEQNVSLQVSLDFPKSKFLHIRLGREPYQRYSSTLDTKFLRNLRPKLDEGGYSFIFGPRVLVIHWLPTWLAPFCLIWAWRKRSLAGTLLGSFGVVAFLIPGVFDFGPLFEGEYLRWQFAAGVAFAALMGLAAAEAVSRYRRLAVPLFLLIALNSLAAEKALNDILINFRRDPGAAQRALTFWYPPTGDWLVSVPEVRFTRDDLEAVKWLSENSQPGDRTLSDFQSVGHTSMLREAAIGGLSATYMVGHELPAPWTPYATAPYLPSAAAMAFRQTRKPEIAAGIGARWLYLDPREGRPTGLEPVFRSSDGLREIFEVVLDPPKTPIQLPSARSDAELDVQGLPPANHSQSGVAYPVQLQFSKKLDGWVTPALLNPEGRVVNRLAPLTVRVNSDSATAFFVPPIEEGPFQVQWLFAEAQDWTLLGEPIQADYQFAPRVQNLLRSNQSSAEGVEIINQGNETFSPGGQVRLLWRVWDYDKDDYRLWIPDGEKLVDLVLEPGETKTIPISLEEKLPARARVDYFLAAQVGPGVPIELTQAAKKKLP
jgi:hypothetical protein